MRTRVEVEAHDEISTLDELDPTRPRSGRGPKVIDCRNLVKLLANPVLEVALDVEVRLRYL